MPRPKGEPRREVTLSIPLRIIDRVDLRLYDTFKGKVQHGARSRLVTELLDNWLSEQDDTSNA